MELWVPSAQWRPVSLLDKAQGLFDGHPFGGLLHEVLLDVGISHADAQLVRHPALTVVDYMVAIGALFLELTRLCHAPQS